MKLSLRPLVLCALLLLGPFAPGGEPGIGGDPEPLLDPPELKEEPYGYRTPEARRKAVARFGGSAQTEKAVESALAWLARHQERDGRWAGEKWGSKRDKRPSTAMTGLAAAALLAAGHTHKSGKYADNVKRALQWLASQQHSNGGILGGREFRYSHYDGYSHAMGALALCEAYGMSRDPALKPFAQKSVDYSFKVHQKSGSGWRYKPGQEGDISHTGWFLMQLKSAKVAGLKVDGAAFQGAMNLCMKLVGRKTGRSVYELAQAGVADFDGGLGNPTTARRTAISMACRLFMGVARNDGLMKKGSRWVLACKPAWNKRDFYGLYYGTLAMFQMGGDAWRKWNEPMKKMLLENQRKGGPMNGSEQDVDGSWDAEKGCWDCGRVFSTALGALSLEVYYRYKPLYAK